ncbi:MAG: hypothetical protein ACRD96_19565, partial [Bryobacteraceae bacterium]
MPLLLLTTLALIAQTPVVNEGGVGNAAITSTREVSPGSLVSIFGSELAPVLPPGSSVPVSVTFNNIQAPILFASPGQINTQLPWDVIPAAAETGTASVVVTRSNVASVPRQVPIRRITPGIFAVNNRAIAVNFPDGTLAQPAGALPPFDSQPARPGGVIILYANGLGPVDPPIATGATSGDGPLRFNTT